MKCPKCGKELVDNRCESCGVRIITDSTPNDDVVFFNNNENDNSVIDLSNDPEAAKKVVRDMPSTTNVNTAYGIIGLIVIILFVFLLFKGCSAIGSSNKKDGINPPLSAKDCEGKNYKDVKKLFVNAGFKNVTEIAVEDLKIGLLASEDEVESVTIGGEEDFSAKDRFDKNEQVIISYHAYPGASKNKVEEESEPTKSTPSSGEIAVPMSAKDCKTKDYRDIESKFRDAGFKNIVTEKLEDMVIGLLVSEDEVEEVSIDGNKKFKKGDVFSESSQIIIVYHAYPEEKTTTTTTKATTTTTTTTTKKTTTTPKTEAPKQETGPLTVSNNADWAYVFTHDCDPSEYRAFVNKYKGCTVEFDGNIAYMDYHGNYTTRFDFLIYPGNYSDTSTSPGIHMRIENANYYDLNLTGANKPSSVTMGLNIHVVATIVEFNRGELMVIKPKSISVR